MKPHKLKMQTASANFAYLAHHDVRLVALATQAEEFFVTDPPTSIAKLRLFAEVLTKLSAAKVGLLPIPNETQQTLIDRLFEKGVEARHRHAPSAHRWRQTICRLLRQETSRRRS